MSQSAFAITDEPGANFRADVNTGLQALASQSSGATAPATTYPYQYWYDTTLNVLKIRNSANTAWVILGPEADSTQNVLYTNNTAQTYTDSTGKTGFGVPTPGYKVDVSGDANVSGIFRVAGVAQTNAARSTIASATTTDLGSVNTSGITISGTTTVTGFGSTTPAGILKYVTLSGAVPITYNATSMILPGAASITGAAGDTFVAESLGSGNWRVLNYQKANGQAVVSASGIPFSDASALVKNSADATKLLIISAANVSTATTRTQSVQDVTDTFVYRNSTDTLTNKTLTSPTLTSPALGTPASGNLSNCTNIPASLATANAVGSYSLLHILSGSGGTTIAAGTSTAGSNLIDITGNTVSGSWTNMNAYPGNGNFSAGQFAIYQRTV